MTNTTSKGKLTFFVILTLLTFCALIVGLSIHGANAMISTEYENDHEKKTFSFKSLSLKNNGEYPILFFKNNAILKNPHYQSMIQKVYDQKGMICLLNPSNVNSYYIEEFFNCGDKDQSPKDYSRLDFYILSQHTAHNRRAVIGEFTKREFVLKKSKFEESAKEAVDKISADVILLGIPMLTFSEEDKVYLVKEITEYQKNQMKELPLLINVKY